MKQRPTQTVQDMKRSKKEMQKLFCALMESKGFAIAFRSETSLSHGLLFKDKSPFIDVRRTSRHYQWQTTLNRQGHLLHLRNYHQQLLLYSEKQLSSWPFKHTDSLKARQLKLSEMQLVDFLARYYYRNVCVLLPNLLQIKNYWSYSLPLKWNW